MRLCAWLKTVYETKTTAGKPWTTSSVGTRPSSGRVFWHPTPYGTVTITRGGQTQSTDPLGQHWTFTGRFFDEETDVYYYRARFMEPSIGRFFQRDPLGPIAGPGPYEYAASSPSTYLDPLGLAP